VLWGLSESDWEENRANRKLCHLNPFEFFDHTRFFGNKKLMVERLSSFRVDCLPCKAIKKRQADLSSFKAHWTC